MKRISITGADATGKTSLLKNLIELKASQVKVFFSPHFHKTEPHPLNSLSRVIEKINLIANEKELRSLKALALLIGMTLYSEYEGFFAKKYQPKFLVSERHCIVDALAFFPVYRETIAGIGTKKIPWEQWLAPLEYQELQNWMIKIASRIKGPSDEDPWQVLTNWIYQLTQLDQMSLTKAWSDFYQCALPERIIILTAEFSTLEKRIALREKEQIGKKREWHEQGKGLLKLQESFLQTGLWLTENHLATVRVVKTDDVSSENLAKKILFEEFI